jgi:CDP-diacylglycerol--glycerol-3-phosphate 3-phosphatidyltransferase
MTDYHALSRTLFFAYLALFTSSLVFFALRRPPTPERVKKYNFAVRWLGRWMYWYQAPVIRGMDAAGLNANGVTFLGLGLTAVAALFAGYGNIGLAGIVLVLANWCDLLDGELARRQGTVHPAGAFLDSNLDRLSEVLLFGGLAAGLPATSGRFWAFAALSTSLLVSYARARGEGLGVECPKGGFERPHRMLVLMFTLLGGTLVTRGQALFAAEMACAVIALGAGYTAVQRMVTLYSILRRREPSSTSATKPQEKAPARLAPRTGELP